MKTFMNRMEVKKQPKMMKKMKYRYMYWLYSYTGCNFTCRHKPEWLLVSVSVPAPLATMGLVTSVAIPVPENVLTPLESTAEYIMSCQPVDVA